MVNEQCLREIVGESMKALCLDGIFASFDVVDDLQIKTGASEARVKERWGSLSSSRMRILT